MNKFIELFDVFVNAGCRGLQIPEDKINCRESGEIWHNGWSVMYRFGHENDLEFMDVWSHHRMRDLGGGIEQRIFLNGIVLNISGVVDCFGDMLTEQDIAQRKISHDEFNEKWKDQLLRLKEIKDIWFADARKQQR